MELIVAFDATEESKNALRSAIQMARRTGAKVTAVHSVEQSVSETETDGGHPIIEGLDTAVERGDRVIQHARDLAGELDYDIETDVAYGSPADTVIDYATTREEAAIYVGHRSFAAGKPAVGSVAQRLIRDSPVPVTVVN
jgi:nucleotide-binding universal stress UspA family protein